MNGFTDYPFIVHNALNEGPFEQILRYSMNIDRPLPVLAVVFSLVAATIAGLALPAHAADWYVASLNSPPKSAAPSGSEEDPFASVNAAINSGKVNGGDRILLKDGPHGSLQLQKKSFDSQVTITSQNDRDAQLDHVLIQGSSNIRLLNLSVWPTDPLTAPRWLVQSDSTSSDIVVEGLVVRSEQGDVEKFAYWDAAMWEARKFSGINLAGPRSTALKNDLMGIAFGITLFGDDSKAIDNVVNFFNGDGLRGLGNNNVFLRNQVFNCIITDQNHADGFQSWSRNSVPVSGLVLDSNVIIEWTHPNKNNPLRCRLQGIGLFDGFYDDLTIINNLITTTQYHGISVYGVRNAIISNNTVAHTDNVTGPHPYIGVRNHKNGSLTTGVLVSNNVAMSFTGSPDMGSAVEYRNNSVIGTPGVVFENPFALDYRPKASSGFIDTGDAASATSVDILGTPRNSGKGPDRGAYEVLAADTPAQPTAPDESTEPETEIPVEPDPAVTEPVVSEPSEPVVTEPVSSEPVVVDPTSTEPIVTEPVVAEPVVTDPLLKKPAAPKGKGKRWMELSSSQWKGAVKTLLRRLVGIAL
jgi:hypothetical protein